MEANIFQCDLIVCVNINCRCNVMIWVGGILVCKYSHDNLFVTVWLAGSLKSDIESSKNNWNGSCNSQLFCFWICCPGYCTVYVYFKPVTLSPLPRISSLKKNNALNNFRFNLCHITYWMWAVMERRKNNSEYAFQRDMINMVHWKYFELQLHDVNPRRPGRHTLQHCGFLHRFNGICILSRG